MIDQETIQQLKPSEKTIFMGLRGSKAHNTYDPSISSIDDIDLMSVFIAPEEHYLGFGRKDTVEKWVGQYDSVSYEIRKMFSLLLKSNPNVLSCLWLPTESRIISSYHWDKIVKSRHIFASKKVYKAFCGYASGQLRRMTRYVENNPERDKEIESLNSEIQHREAMEKNYGQGNYGRDPYKDYSMKKLRTRYNDLRGTQGYMGERRREMVQKYGYDLKNCQHTVMLLRQGIEFLRTGEMRVDRSKPLVVGEQEFEPDADYLKAIKSGEYPLETMQKESENLFEKAKEAVEKSPLPDEPDREAAENLLVDILKYNLSDEQCSP